jgi:hypothetical protein
LFVGLYLKPQKSQPEIRNKKGGNAAIITAIRLFSLNQARAD